MILLIIISGLFIVYSTLIIYYWQAWNSIPEFVATETSTPLKISVIIPARNEEDNIGNLLDALPGQSYSESFFEVIVVDDHSTDKTAEIVRGFPKTQLITLKEEEINSYKKKAIETGIAAATGDLIVTTDADCIPGPNWLK